MKQLSNKFILAIALVFGLAACAVTDFDRDIDFGHYRTFAWGPSEIKVDNPDSPSAEFTSTPNTPTSSWVTKRIRKNGVNPIPTRPMVHSCTDRTSCPIDLATCICPTAMA